MACSCKKSSLCPSCGARRLAETAAHRVDHVLPRRAGLQPPAHERKKLEHLCRYISRPAIANERLALNRAGQVVLTLRHPIEMARPIS